VYLLSEKPVWHRGGPTAALRGMRQKRRGPRPLPPGRRESFPHLGAGGEAQRGGNELEGTAQLGWAVGR